MGLAKGSLQSSNRWTPHWSILHRKRNLSTTKVRQTSIKLRYYLMATLSSGACRVTKHAILVVGVDPAILQNFLKIRWYSLLRVVAFDSEVGICMSSMVTGLRR